MNKEKQAQVNTQKLREIIEFNEKQASNNITNLFNPTRNENKQVRTEIIKDLEERGVFD